MKKRAILSLCILIFAFSAVAIRMSYIVSHAAAAVSAEKNEKTIDIGTIRGQIFDCNMNPLVDVTPQYYAAVLPKDAGIDFVNNHFTAEEANAIKERLLNGKPICEPLAAYAQGNDAVTVIRTAKRYDNNQLAAHLIGYTDYAGDGVCGIEKAFQDVLSENSFPLAAKFSINGRGQAMAGGGITIENGNKEQKSGVILSIDRSLQQITETVLNQNHITCGAVIISDINTGDIKAMASRPTYNPNRIAASMEDENAPFLNRALQSYTVGSVFKPVIAAAALEYGLSSSLTFSCGGMLSVNGVAFHCHEEDGHNTVNMKSAIAQSCNLYFIQLAIKIPRNFILKTAEAFGFGSKTDLAPGIAAGAGHLPPAEELDSDAAKANLSFGQGSLLATPLQINAMTACIANGGIYHTPRLVTGKTDTNGNITYYPKGETYRAVSESTAELLRESLRAVITEGTGKRAAPAGVEAAGKTATAQTGHFDENGEQHNAWFTGFFPYVNPCYAVTVLIENGGEGALSAAPLFKQISESIIEWSKA